MKEEGIPSPDLWDTTCMAFLEKATYIVSDAAGRPRIASKDDTVDKLKALMDEALGA
jgi:hypothetical protein